MMEELDPLIDCIDESQSDMRVVRRAQLAGCLSKHKVVLVTQRALNYATQAARIFDAVTMLEWLGRVWPKQLHDPEERALRFGEESIELVQTEGVTREQMHKLVDQVYDKPAGEPEQEVGGVLMTLSAYLAVKDIDGINAFSEEWSRVNDPSVIERIQEKHFHKLVVSSKQR